jgi:hypothetical protein
MATAAQGNVPLSIGGCPMIIISPIKPTITSMTGRKFELRVITQGETYGRSAVWDKDRPAIEFLDITNDVAQPFGACYYFSTLLDDANKIGEYGLCLNGGEPEDFGIPPAEMRKAIDWMRSLLKTPMDLQELKDAWVADRAWDLEETPGFELYRHELKNFALDFQQEAQERELERLQAFATEHDISLSDAAVIDTLHVNANHSKEIAGNTLIHYFKMAIPALTEDQNNDLKAAVDHIVTAAANETKIALMLEKRKQDSEL